MCRGKSLFWLALAAFVAAAPNASAGVFESLYRGLQLYATPSGAPVVTTANGTQNGQRFGRVRITPNILGDGWDVIVDRTFGVDSAGRSEIFDFGNVELELAGTIATTASITQRGIPTVNLTNTFNSLAYSLRGKTGVQDFELQGVLGGTQSYELNPLGFYTVNYEFTNTNAALIADGLALDGDIDTDFNIGPISVEGNFYFDIFVAALASFGVDTTELEQIFPASPINRITEDIRASLEAQANDALATARGRAVTDDAILRRGLAGITASADLDLDGASAPAAGDSSQNFAPAPEPSALLLLGVGAAFMATRLIRRR